MPIRCSMILPHGSSIGSEGHSMKKLKVDRKELVSEMEMGDNLELAGYLDTETGEIISMPDNVMRAVEDSDEAAEARPDWEQGLVESAGSILGDEKNRFLLIPK